MINKKSIILSALCTVASINSVIAVDTLPKQEQCFSPETVAKIKKVALATGLSVAAVATIALVYRFGIKSDIEQVASAPMTNGIAAMSMTQDPNDPISLKALIIKWLKEHGAIVNMASTGAGFIGGSRLGYVRGFTKGMKTFYRLLPNSLKNSHRSIAAVIKQFPNVFLKSA